MLCPNCKTRYEASQSMCPDCFADLVEAPGAEPASLPTRRERPSSSAWTSAAEPTAGAEAPTPAEAPEAGSQAGALTGVWDGRGSESKPSSQPHGAAAGEDPPLRSRVADQPGARISRSQEAQGTQATQPAPARPRAATPSAEKGRLAPPSPIRPAGRIRYEEPSPAANLFTWGVAAALLVGLGVGGWRLTHRSAPATSAQTAGADLPSAERSLAEARRHLAQGSYGDAAREARLALELLGPRAGNMATRPAREVLAQSLLKSQDCERAAAEYKLLASYFPEEKSYADGYQQARTALSAGQQIEADAAWRQARQQFAAGHYREAADQADTASLIYASLPDGSKQRVECRRLAAQAYAHQGAYRAAVYAWSEVLQARPHDSAAQAGLAEAEHRLEASARRPEPIAHAAPVRVVRPVARPVTVSSAPVPVTEHAAYPTASKKRDEFYPSDSPQDDAKARAPRLPRAQQQPEADDPYAEGAPPPGPGGSEEVPPPLPPLPGPPAAAARPQLPRLPSLSYPAGGAGNGIPGYTPAQRPGPANQGTQGGLPGYYSEKGRQNGGSGIPGL